MHCRPNVDVCTAAVHGQIKKGVSMKLYNDFVRARFCGSCFPNDEMPSKNKSHDSTKTAKHTFNLIMQFNRVKHPAKHVI